MNVLTGKWQVKSDSMMGTFYYKIRFDLFVFVHPETFAFVFSQQKTQTKEKNG